MSSLLNKYDVIPLPLQNVPGEASSSNPLGAPSGILFLSSDTTKACKVNKLLTLAKSSPKN